MPNPSSLHSVTALVVNEGTGDMATLACLIAFTADAAVVTFRIAGEPMSVTVTPGQAAEFREALRRAYQEASVDEPPARRLA